MVPVGQIRRGEVLKDVTLSTEKSARSIANEHYMTIPMLSELNPNLSVEGDSSMVPKGTKVRVFQVWRYGRDTSNKLTAGGLEDLYYCSRHASVRVTKTLLDKLVSKSQELDKAASTRGNATTKHMDHILGDFIAPCTPIRHSIQAFCIPIALQA